MTRHSDVTGQIFDCPVSFGTNGTFTPPTASAVNLYTLSCHIDTTVSATARVARVPVPVSGAGTVVQIDVVTDVAIATGDMTVTGAIGGVGMTSGVVTLPSGTAAGTLRSASPSAANTVAAGNILSAAVGGANTGDGRATVTFTIRRS